MTAAYIAGGIGAALGLAGIVSYNRFVSQRNLVHNSWSNVDSELRRRYDLIPNLVEVVKGYAAHERSLFEQVTRMRAAAVAATSSPAHQAAAENPLVEALRRLLFVAESYPELRAGKPWLALQRDLADTEDRIQAARRFYNANVRDLNRRVESFPSNLVARTFGFGRAEYFRIAPAVRSEQERAPSASAPE